MSEQIWEERTNRNRSASRMISRSRSVSRMAATVGARLKRGRREDSMHQPYRIANGRRSRQILCSVARFGVLLKMYMVPSASYCRLNCCPRLRSEEARCGNAVVLLKFHKGGFGCGTKITGLVTGRTRTGGGYCISVIIEIDL